MSSDLAEGEVLLGRFTLVYALDRGGPSQTWVAEDTELLEEVVLRILDPETATRAHRERIRIACRRTRRLRHPHIAPTFDFHRDGAWCFVSRAFVEGRSVASFGGRPPRELLEKLVQGLDALEHAHARGISHGDLRETKILVDRSGNLQITDFLTGGALQEGLVPSRSEGSGVQEPEAQDLTALGRIWLRLLTGSMDSPTASEEAAARLVSAGVGADAARALARLAVPARAGFPHDLGTLRETIAGSISDTASGADESVAARDVSTAHEKVIVPVRPAERAEGLKSQEDARSRRRAVGAAFAVLLGVALLVFLWLPRLVSGPEGPAASRQGPPAATGAVPEAPAEGVSSTEVTPDVARKLLGEALNRADALRKRGAAEWAAAEFGKAEELLASGERAQAESDFGRAADAYRQALGLLDQVEVRSVAALESALESAASTVESDLDSALAQYELALRIDPDNRAAQQGAGSIRAAKLVSSSMREGQRHESEGDLTAARDAYAKATAADPGSAKARAALERVEASLAASAYKRHMARAMTSLAKNDLGAAEAQVRSALSLRPGSKEALQLRQRVEQKKLAVEIQKGRSRAESLAKAEKWDEAAAEYRRLLKLDPTLAFATEGFNRSERMASASRRFDAWIAKPSLLFDARAREEARQLLEFAGQTAHQGPRTEKQVRQVAAIEKAASTPISVVFESDGSTEVKVQRHGTLGTFTRREIPLTPGTYVVLGIRRGFRDVRQTVTVVPGVKAPTVVVSCREAI